MLLGDSRNQKMSGSRWGNRGKSTSSDDSDDGSDGMPAVKQTKKSSKISFLQKSKHQDSYDIASDGAGKPPRMRGMLRITKSADHYSDCERSVDDETGQGILSKQRSRFTAPRLKRHKSAEDSNSSDFPSLSSKGKSNIFRIKNKKVGQTSGFDSDGSLDDDSVTEKEAAKGSLKKTIGFLRNPLSSIADSSTNKGRPPLGSSSNRPRSTSGDSIHGGGPQSKGVSFSDNSLRGGSNHGGDDSDYMAASPGNRVDKKPNRERARYSVYHGAGTRAVKRKFRVRPYRAFSEPVHMTEEEIYADSLQPSKNAEFLKSYMVPSSRKTKNMDIPDQIRTQWGTPNEDGRIGSLRVEILGCVSLNRTKPDVCAYAVCGDTAFCTDIIQGYRSPMWPSPCKRAAVFPIHHAFAKLYIGVFDVRKRTNKDNDVFCGRVVLDIANIRPDTEYDTTMPLRVSSFVYDRRKRGVIRIRFSVHWFSERAAVMSYFKGVHTIDDKNPLVAGNPTIPCADPRSFRNIAYTVHGQDLPGKYSKMAFRATMREMNLYQINLRRTILVCVLDAMFYENKLVSVYLFVSAMFCVYCNSVALVPAICVGYVLIQYLNNYRHYVQKTEFNFGYKPLTILELAKSIIVGGRNIYTDPSQLCMVPIEVDKWTKRRSNVDNKFKSITEDDEKAGLLDDGKTIRPLDHREFPFSQRDAYPFFGVEDALAAGSSKGDTGRLHGRLSVYYSAPEAGEVGAEARSAEDDDDDDESDQDDETVLSESQMLGDGGFDMDSGSDEDDEDNLQGADHNYIRVAQAQKQQKGKTRIMARVHLGPPQDADVKGKKVPPQVTLKKLENMMYKFSGNVSVEFVHSGPQDSNDTDFLIDTGMTPPSKELRNKMAQKAKKAQADEYDKILGYSVSYTNPIQRIMSSFMGPVMRMMRVGTFIMRIVYNLSAWRDPILSFWLLVFFVVLFLILLVFPWRAFFFLTSMATLGPQNLFLRKILERKAREQEEKKKQEDEQSTSEKSDDASTRSKHKKGNFIAKALTRVPDKKYMKELRDNLDPSSRTAFSTTGASVTGSKRMPSRAVVVPYNRLKKDRFWNWPPDPTVSRANPIPLFESLNDDDSMTLSAPEVVMEDYEEGKSPLRQRKSGQVVSEGNFVVPQDIAF